MWGFFQAEATRLSVWLAAQPGLAQDLEDAVGVAIAEYDWTSWEELRPSLQPVLEEQFAQGATSVLDALAATGVDLGTAFVATEAQVWAEARAAELVGTGTRAGWSLTQTTRDELRTDLEAWLREGLSWLDIARRIRQGDYGTFMPAYRARMIARTESALAYGNGNVASMRAAGVREVRIFDGVRWDEPCREADGATWTLDRYAANVLQHPNCARVATAIMPEMSKAAPPDPGHLPALGWAEGP